MSSREVSETILSQFSDQDALRLNAKPVPPCEFTLDEYELITDLLDQAHMQKLGLPVPDWRKMHSLHIVVSAIAKSTVNEYNLRRRQESQDGR